MLPYPLLLIVAQRSRTVLCHPNTEVVASDRVRRIDLLCLRGLCLFVKVESHRLLKNQIHQAGKREILKRIWLVHPFT